MFISPESYNAALDSLKPLSQKQIVNQSQVANTNSGSSNKAEQKKKRARTVKATLGADKKLDNTGKEHANNPESENASTVAPKTVDKSMPDDNIEQNLDDVPSLKQKEETHSASSKIPLIKMFDF